MLRQPLVRKFQPMNVGIGLTEARLWLSCEIALHLLVSTVRQA
jgi:hypothetical protein